MKLLKRLYKNKMIVIGSVIITFVVLIALFAPFLTPYKYDAMNLRSRTVAPNFSFIMGTDEFGRDIWTRVIYGARISLTISMASVFIGLSIGCFLGLLGGYLRGPFDFFLGRIMDVMMSIPALVLALLIGVTLGASLFNMCITIGVPIIPFFYRNTRGMALRVGERTYVIAARSMGAGKFRIMFRHILPNTLSQIFVIMSFAMGISIMAEAALGYLGLGIPAPMPSWGILINDGKQYIFDAPWIIAFSGGMIAFTILAFNLLGDGLRDFLDPKLRL
jgi:ABC-type dipeptide/oligopeptide/nickel transport system permease subunit